MRWQAKSIRAFRSRQRIILIAAKESLVLPWRKTEEIEKERKNVLLKRKIIGRLLPSFAKKRVKPVDLLLVKRILDKTTSVSRIINVTIRGSPQRGFANANSSETVC